MFTAERTNIGLTRRAALVYRWLLQFTELRKSRLAVELGIAGPELDEVIHDLEQDGVVHVSGTVDCTVRAVEPCIALPLLMARRITRPGPLQPSPVEVKRFIKLHEQGTDRLQTADAGNSEHRLTVLIERMVSKVEHSLLYLVPDCAEGAAELSRPVAEMALHRCAGVRTVWASSLFGRPEAAAHSRWLAEREVAPRSSAVVPVRAVIVDDVAAAMITSDGSARLVRNRPEVKRLASLAEQVWEGSVPIGRPRHIRSTKVVQRPRSQTVLRLLAEGFTDDAIARQLDCSVRTVRTEVAQAMHVLGARSRFQAGARAVQVGLV